MTDLIKNIVIVGGGTAGWLTANILASQINQNRSTKIDITLIESPDIPTIGVGEGTVPTMRQTLQMIGIRETEFIKQCDATFKQSIKFVDWQSSPQLGQTDYYHHLFHYPLSPGFDVTTHWLQQNVNESKSLKYSDIISMQGGVCDLGLSPKKITTKEYQGIFDYAYHLDAGKFAGLLSKHGVEHWGIDLIKDTVENVTLNEQGEISGLKLSSGHLHTADLYIDCTGFKARLISGALGVEFENKNDVLFVDKALTAQVPYQNDDEPIASHTIATAKEAGWIWDIGLNTRRGVGFVYSSKYCDEATAEKTMHDYLGSDGENIEFRSIDMNIGYRKKFWHKNCVAIGLSAGFLEPLEATAILLIEATAKLIAEQFPHRKANFEHAANQVNEITKYGWDRTIDFIKLHYCLSNRDDSQFWLDNKERNSIPDTLLNKLDTWQYRAPCSSDFFSKYEVFHLENYQYVLYGMGFRPNFSDIGCNRKLEYQNYLSTLEQKKHELLKTLPRNRVLLEQIYAHGMQRI